MRFRFVRVVGLLVVVFGIIQSGWNLDRGLVFASADQFVRFWIGLTAIVTGAFLLIHDDATLGVCHPFEGEEIPVVWTLRVALPILTCAAASFTYMAADWTFGSQHLALVGFAAVLGTVVLAAGLIFLTAFHAALFLSK